MLSAEPAVSAIVHMPCDQANTTVRPSVPACSASKAVQAGVQIAALIPPANITPPNALASRSKLRSRVNPKRINANPEMENPDTMKILRPYRSAMIANGTRATVLAIDDAEVMPPIVSAEKPM